MSPAHADSKQTGDFKKSVWGMGGIEEQVILNYHKITEIKKSTLFFGGLLSYKTYRDLT